MRKTKLLKQTLTGTLAATLLLAPVAEPMQGVFFENGIVAKAATTDNEFVIKDGVLVDYNGYGGDVVVPEGVTKIGDSVFKESYDEEDEAMLDGERLKSITLPQSLKSIGNKAFYQCEDLKEIVIPDGVTEIGDSAFYECENLQIVTLPESLTTIKPETFSNCYSLKKINFPKNITEIGNYAFHCCRSLTDITIPESVTIIGSEAFSHCSKLSEITIPTNATSIGDDAFENTIWLKNQIKNTPLFIINTCLVDGTTCTGDVIIPEEVTKICSAAFSENKNITSVTMSDNVTSIGASAFYECENLTNIQLSKNVDYIGGCAFWNTAWSKKQMENTHMLIVSNILLDSDLTGDIIVPDNVTAIADSAFSWSSGITSVTLPEGVTSIGNHAFECCSNLEKIIIPDSVTSIGSEAFFSCSALKTITLPNKLTRIEENLLYECDSLESIVVPDTVTSIGSDAFRYCNKLKGVTIPKSVTDIGSHIITNYPGVIIYGEKDSVAADYAKNNSLNFVIAGTDFVMPKKVTISSVKRKSSTSLKISCKKTANADGYQMLISKSKATTNSGENKHLSAEIKLFTKSNTKTVSKLKKNKTYYVQVRAYKMDSNNKRAYGPWSTIKKVKLKK